jgi:hypothetical protein
VSRQKLAVTVTVRAAVAAARIGSFAIANPKKNQRQQVVAIAVPAAFLLKGDSLLASANCANPAAVASHLDGWVRRVVAWAWPGLNVLRVSASPTPNTDGLRVNIGFGHIVNANPTVRR